MSNRGKYRHWVEIWQDKDGEDEDELGNKIPVPTKVGGTFARVESRVGSLLSGRAADTVVSKTTHKITWDYKNFPEVVAGVQYIKFENRSFDIDYSLDEEFRHEELQVFCNELS